MRHHVLVSHRLKRLQSDHGFTDEQLKAIAPYLAKLDKRQLLDIKPHVTMSDSQFNTWYSPTKN